MLVSLNHICVSVYVYICLSYMCVLSCLAMSDFLQPHEL